MSVSNEVLALISQVAQNKCQQMKNCCLQDLLIL